MKLWSAPIWKKSEPKVFNWSEFHISQVTSYKIHTLIWDWFFTTTRKSDKFLFAEMLLGFQIQVGNQWCGVHNLLPWLE